MMLCGQVSNVDAFVSEVGCPYASTLRYITDAPPQRWHKRFEEATKSDYTPIGASLHFASRKELQRIKLIAAKYGIEL